MTKLQQPFFSVVVPTYNMAQWLPYAIESALNQTFSDFELLIQDNASTDKTRYIVKKYQDSRISYQMNPTNIGLFQNANLVCARATGKYIKVLCADDVLSPVCLEVIHSQVINNEGYKYKLISVNSTENENSIDLNSMVDETQKQVINRDNLFKFLCQIDNWGAGLPTFCVENIFFRSYGFWGRADIDSDFSKDVFTWFLLSLESPALLIDKKLIYVRPHSGQNRYIINYINQLREVFAFFEKCQTLGYNTLPNFNRGYKAYLDDHIVRHYLYGLKALFKKRKFDYLNEVLALKKQYNYSGFPWYMAFKKAILKLNRQSD